MSAVMANILERVSRMEEKHKGANTKEVKVEDIIQVKYEELTSEAKEKDKRKFNLIVVNLSEVQGVDKEERAHKEIEQIEKLITNVIPESESPNEIEIKNPLILV